MMDHIEESWRKKRKNERGGVAATNSTGPGVYSASRDPVFRLSGCQVSPIHADIQNTAGSSIAVGERMNGFKLVILNSAVGP